MSERFHTLPRHEVCLVIAGQAYQGWTAIDIDLGIDGWVGSFELELSAKAKTGEADFVIPEGAECQVVLGGKALITGFVDKVTRSVSATERRVSVSGRDKAADLVDCSAVHKPGSWRNVKIDAIAKELAQPFGVTIKFTGDTGQPLKRFALQPGETVFAAIERLCRYRGLICYSDGTGQLIVGNPDSGKQAGAIQYGNNGVAITHENDQSERFSKYIVKGQASGDDERHGKPVAQIKAEVEDKGVKRYRPLIIIGEEQSDLASLKKRAEWEKTVRAARGQRTRATVPGWFGGNGSASGPVWEPGARADVQAEAVGVTGSRLIERVRLRRDNSGTSAELELVPPEAWTQMAEKEEKA